MPQTHLSEQGSLYEQSVSPPLPCVSVSVGGLVFDPASRDCRLRLHGARLCQARAGSGELRRYLACTWHAGPDVVVVGNRNCGAPWRIGGFCRSIYPAGERPNGLRPARRDLHGPFAEAWPRWCWEDRGRWLWIDFSCGGRQRPQGLVSGTYSNTATRRRPYRPRILSRIDRPPPSNWR